MSTFSKTADNADPTRRCITCTTPYVEGETVENHNEQGDWMCSDCQLFTMLTEPDKLKEISACNCMPHWDIRCCCFPPMITKSFPATMTDEDINWYKKDGYQDNWDNCPMKVELAVAHYTDSRLAQKNMTKKGEYNLKYAKWVFGLMGLNQAQVKEAIDIMKDQREEERKDD